MAREQRKTVTVLFCDLAGSTALGESADPERLRTLLASFQWGLETFHDLVEQVALLSTGTPILLLCMARTELVERRPTWPVSLRLEPLDETSIARLIGDKVPAALRERITHAAGGNPLFVGEMLAFVGIADGDVVVPPTLRALLTARLDQLEPPERTVLERGAIEGEIFHTGAVHALSPDRAQVMPVLAALVRRGLIRPDRAQLPGQDAFRFRHLLIRDATYEAMPKTVRADLHARYASWLEGHGTALVERDEVVGYHLEQACRYLADVGSPDDGSLSTRAQLHLYAAGHRAALYQDYAAAVSLFERANALASPDEFDLGLETELGEALLWAGRGGDALDRAHLLADRASRAGNRVCELCGRLRAGVLSLYVAPQGAKERLDALIDEALPVLEAAGDDLALYIAYSALGELADVRARYDEVLEAYERALVHAERAGHQTIFALAARASSRFLGTTPAPELLAWLKENEPEAGRDYFLRAYRADALGMLGRFDEARAILTEDRAEQAARGGGTLLANLTAFESVWIELWADDPAAAAEFGAEGWRQHSEQGNQTFLSPAAGHLAEAHYRLGRLDEAEQWALQAQERATDNVWSKVLWRKVRAKVLARRGRHAEAQPLVREAVALCDETDMIDVQGDVYADLAEVLELAGKPDEASAALQQALERYERKGNVVSAARVRERLLELTPAV